MSTPEEPPATGTRDVSSSQITSGDTPRPDHVSRTGTGIGRRRLLGAALGGAGLVVGAGAGLGTAEASRSDSDTGSDDTVPFYGARQAGVATAQQDQLAFAAFDVTTVDVAELKAMLGRWSAAAALMCQGKPIGPTETAPQKPPVDTGEALGLGARRLTVTVGFGPSLFDDRFGLADKRPAALAPLPALPGDELDPSRSDGDLCVQACADDPQVAFHAIRDLSRIGHGTVVMRWSQLGFGRTAATTEDQQTPRNLMGFKDGTNNIKAEQAELMNRWVWVGGETDRPWMRDGTYMVTRRIRMMIETWDVDYIADQENVFGRYKESGAPLTGKREFDPVRLNATGKDGKPVIPLHAHIRLASHVTNDGVRLLRRGYSYTDGTDPETGELDAGLFFVCFNQDPHKQFAALQTKLGSKDALTEYIKHTSSALFAVPPGLREVGDWFGKDLFV